MTGQHAIPLTRRGLTDRHVATVTVKQGQSGAMPCWQVRGNTSRDGSLLLGTFDYRDDAERYADRARRLLSEGANQ